MAARAHDDARDPGAHRAPRHVALQRRLPRNQLGESSEGGAPAAGGGGDGGRQQLAPPLGERHRDGKAAQHVLR